MENLKTIVFVFLCLLCGKTFGQFTSTQPLGYATTLTDVKGGLRTGKGIINAVYADTATANSGNIKYYPGAQIVAGELLYIRNATATAWVPVGNSTTGGNATDTASLSYRINQKAEQNALQDSAYNIRADFPVSMSACPECYASLKSFGDTILTFYRQNGDSSRVQFYLAGDSILSFDKNVSGDSIVLAFRSGRRLAVVSAGGSGTTLQQITDAQGGRGTTTGTISIGSPYFGLSSLEIMGSLGTTMTILNNAGSFTLDATMFTIVVVTTGVNIILPNGSQGRIHIIKNETASPLSISSYRNMAGVNGTTSIPAASSVMLQSHTGVWWRIL